MNEFGGFFDVSNKQIRLKDIEDQIAADPKFWDNPQKTAPILQEKKNLETTLLQIKTTSQMLDDLNTAIEFVQTDPDFFEEAKTLVEQLGPKLKELEVESLLSDPLDKVGAMLTINAGAGGTESCDWAEMLLRMYLRFVERKEWKGEIHDTQDGDGAGLKSATIEITGTNVFGLLKSESGVHRLVRISPFDSNARRHTSFASVFVTPLVEDEIEISIQPTDLRIDTYRASGAGGQHVNRTDSAVRITHLPTNIVVQCQSQRSQHQNRDTAMKMLKSKLYEKELHERKKKQQQIESEKSEIGFGSQIRSYILHPYKMVKDHRTQLESHDPNQVLDGNILPFIESFLSKDKSNH